MGTCMMMSIDSSKSESKGAYGKAAIEWEAEKQTQTLCSAAPAASSLTVFSSHTAPIPASNHQPANSIFLSHHSSHQLQLQPSEANRVKVCKATTSPSPGAPACCDASCHINFFCPDWCRTHATSGCHSLKRTNSYRFIECVDIQWINCCWSTQPCFYHKQLHAC